MSSTHTKRKVRDRSRRARTWWRQTWPQVAHTAGWASVAWWLGREATGGHPDGLLLTAAALLIGVHAAKKRGEGE